MKKFTFIIYILSLIVLGVIGAWIGMYAYKINSIGKLESPVLEGMENKNLEKELALAANEDEEKVSPNATLVIKTMYKKCNHILNDTMQLDSKYVNLTKEEFEKVFLSNNSEYSKVEEFSPKKIIVRKEIDENCDQHYVLKGQDGVIIIYKLAKDGNESVYKKTNIDLSYLTEEDKILLKNGIEVLGESELNSKLEDYV